jgi:hypothetical protein
LLHQCKIGHNILALLLLMPLLPELKTPLHLTDVELEGEVAGVEKYRHRPNCYEHEVRSDARQLLKFDARIG